MTINILAIETSSHACSAAVLKQSKDGIQVFEVFEDAPRQHNVLLLPMLEQVLKQAQCRLTDIQVLAFGRGPGAFTGVRIATSAIQALAFGTDLPVAAISSLAAVAQGIYRLTGQEAVFVANDARMNEVYSGLYRLNNAGVMQAMADEKVLAPEHLLVEYAQDIEAYSGIWSAAGSGWNAYAEILADKLVEYSLQKQELELLPHAQDIAFLALGQLKSNSLLKASQVVPIYLRDNVAKKSVAKKSVAKKSVA